MKPAKLRVCGACEWVFSMKNDVMCPRCDFGSYGAHRVYGKAAYRYAKTQKPWFDKQMASRAIYLRMVIDGVAT